MIERKKYGREVKVKVTLEQTMKAQRD